MGITIDELLSEDNADVLREYLEKSGYVAKDEIEGLKKNKDLLLKEKKKQQTLVEQLKADKEELEAKLMDMEEQINIAIEGQDDPDNGDPHKTDRVKQDLTKGFEKKLEIERRKYEREMKKLAESNSSLNNTLDTFKKNHYNDLVRRKIENGLGKIGVSDIHRKLLVNDFMNRVQYDISDDGYSVSTITITDDESGLPVDMGESLKAFSQSENFKFFQKQPDSSGGGANPTKSDVKGSESSAGKAGQLIPLGTFKTY